MRSSFLYFAYGSNMLTRRLRAADRAPSAQVVAVAELPAHRLTFDKVSNTDGSGKCDAERSGLESDCVHGVVYQIAEHHQAALDRVEGLGHGYQRAMVEVATDSGRLVCRCYLATLKQTGLSPFHWYKGLVLAGAREHKLPPQYIDWLSSIASTEDPDAVRRAQNQALLGGWPGQGNYDPQ